MIITYAFIGLVIAYAGVAVVVAFGCGIWVEKYDPPAKADIVFRVPLRWLPLMASWLGAMLYRRVR